MIFQIFPDIVFFNAYFKLLPFKAFFYDKYKNYSEHFSRIIPNVFFRNISFHLIDFFHEFLDGCRAIIQELLYKFIHLSRALVNAQHADKVYAHRACLGHNVLNVQLGVNVSFRIILRLFKVFFEIFQKFVRNFEKIIIL